MKLKKEFFAQNTENVAQELIGKVIKVNNKYGIIIETECYKGQEDPASHAFGKKTPRNKLMYETYGFTYVYLIYGMHYCLNFTTEKENPGAVLIRGIKEITDDLRGLSDEEIKKLKLIDGPGRVTKYFGIDKSFNGLDLENNDKIEVLDLGIKFNKIIKTPRIGISKAKDKLWRYVVEQDSRIETG